MSSWAGSSDPADIAPGRPAQGALRPRKEALEGRIVPAVVKTFPDDALPTIWTSNRAQSDQTNEEQNETAHKDIGADGVIERQQAAIRHDQLAGTSDD